MGPSTVANGQSPSGHRATVSKLNFAQAQTATDFAFAAGSTFKNEMPGVKLDIAQAQTAADLAFVARKGAIRALVNFPKRGARH